jgi:hypothetical protein
MFPFAIEACSVRQEYEWIKVPVERIVRIVGRLGNKNEIRATRHMLQIPSVFFCMSRSFVEECCPWDMLHMA